MVPTMITESHTNSALGSCPANQNAIGGGCDAASGAFRTQGSRPLYNEAKTPVPGRPIGWFCQCIDPGCKAVATVLCAHIIVTPSPTPSPTLPTLTHVPTTVGKVIVPPATEQGSTSHSEHVFPSTEEERERKNASMTTKFALLCPPTAGHVCPLF